MTTPNDTQLRERSLAFLIRAADQLVRAERADILASEGIRRHDLRLLHRLAHRSDMDAAAGDRAPLEDSSPLDTIDADAAVDAGASRLDGSGTGDSTPDGAPLTDATREDPRRGHSRGHHPREGHRHGDHRHGDNDHGDNDHRDNDHRDNDHRDNDHGSHPHGGHRRGNHDHGRRGRARFGGFRVRHLMMRGWVTLAEGRPTITPEGHRALARVDERLADSRTRIESALTPEQLAITTDALSSIVEELGGTDRLREVRRRHRLMQHLREGGPLHGFGHRDFGMRAAHVDLGGFDDNGDPCARRGFGGGFPQAGFPTGFERDHGFERGRGGFPGRDHRAHRQHTHECARGFGHDYGFERDRGGFPGRDHRTHQPHTHECARGFERGHGDVPGRDHRAHQPHTHGYDHAFGRHRREDAAPPRDDS